MDDCLFCKIAAGDIPAKVVHEDDICVAFEDISPQAPTHVLVIPKRHMSDQRGLADAPANLMGHLYGVVNQVAAARRLDDFRTVVNTGAGAGQTVFHMHIHLLGGRGMSWPPG